MAQTTDNHTVTQSLNAQSNAAVSTLLANAENRKKANRKRLRSELDDILDESPNKKRKIDDKIHSNNNIAPLIIQDDEPLNIDPPQQTNNINNGGNSIQNGGALGFSSDDDSDDEEDSENENEDQDLKKQDPSDDEEFDLLNNIGNNNSNNYENRNNYNEDNALKNDPYWNMMQSINDSNQNLMDIDDTDNDENKNKNDKNKNKKKGVAIEIDIDDTSMFNLQNIDEKNKKNKKDAKQKKAARRFQKWQRDQGLECTRAHLALLVYRARFRSLLCSDCELQARMMSIIPLKLHPENKKFNGIYTEITFKKLRELMTWFINQFGFDANAKQFELKCQKPKDRIPCGVFQLIEYIQDVGDKKNELKSSISHLNLLFLTLLWCFNIPARYVHVLRPISHILDKNKIFDDDYNQIMNQWFMQKPCICQQLDDDNIIDIDGDNDIKMKDTNHNTNHNGVKDKDTKNTKSKKKKKSNRIHRENSGEPWDEDDDLYLYNHRDDEVETLSSHFSRTRTSIRNRLEHLVDPQHAAYKRLHGDKPPIINDKDKTVKRRPVNIDVNYDEGSVDIMDSDIDAMDVDENEDEEEEEYDSEPVKKKTKRRKTAKKKSKKKETKSKKKTKKKLSKKKRKERIKSYRKEKSMQRWSIEDDIYLWEYRDDSVQLLADTLNRSKTGIKRRLEVLRDRSSKQRKRLFDKLSPSKQQQKLNQKVKPKKIQRPDFSHLGQNFIYKKGKGSMVECIEVYIADRKEWVHVLLDKGRIHIDGSENNLHQCDCERSNNKFNYVISVDKFGCINDVTPRYAELWSVALNKRVMHNDFYNEILTKWESENEQLSFQYGWQCIIQHKLWKDIMKQDKIQIDQCIQSEPLPKSEGGYRNHPLYVIEKFVKKYELIYPKDDSQVIGKIKGQNVYPISNLRDLHTRERWYKLGYVVKAGETFVKQVKTSHMSKSEEEFTDLFGKWQCVEYIAPKIGPNDKLPVNSRGNIELWSDLHLPTGCVHITRANCVFALKRMKIPYAKAMVGFDQRKGRSVPVFDGYVIHKSHEKELHKIIDEMDIKRKEREKEKEMKQMCGLWRVLVQGIMVQHQLASAQREKEANRQIVTTKEFNAMMNQDHVEDL